MNRWPNPRLPRQFDYEPTGPFRFIAPRFYRSDDEELYRGVCEFVDHALPARSGHWGALMDSCGVILLSNECGTVAGRVWVGVEATFKLLRTFPHVVDVREVDLWEIEAKARVEAHNGP